MRPSNFALSVLVKLASRSHRLERALELCEEISRKYHFRLNIHVYNLMHACATHQDIAHALGLLKQVAHEKVRPRSRWASAGAATRHWRGS